MKSSIHRRSCGTLGIAILAAFAAVAPQDPLPGQDPPAYTFEKRAQLGDTVAGGQLAFDFEPGTINRAGDIGLGADYIIKDALGVDQNGEGIFRSRRGAGMRLITRFDLPAPGNWKNAKSFWGPVMLNDSGDLTFVFWLQDAPVAEFGGLFVYLNDADAILPIILPGDQAPPSPNGGVFVGAGPHATINNQHEVGSSALIRADDFGTDVPPGRDNLGVGIFLQDSTGLLRSIVRPGDPAPGGGKFSYAVNPFINNSGDLGFDAILIGDPCVPVGSSISCTVGVFLRKRTGEIIPLAPIGSAAPGGGTIRNAFGSILNEFGQATFVGDISPPGEPLNSRMCVFFYNGQEVIAVARPGDPVPGGGRIKTCGNLVGSSHLNNRGEVTFNATLDTTHLDAQKATFPDQGLYLWRDGGIRLVARTDTSMTGLGTIELLVPPDFKAFFPANYPWPYTGTASNDLGEIILVAAFYDGSCPLLVATPAPVSLHLGKAAGKDGVYDALLTVDEPAEGFSFALLLDGECAGGQITRVEPGEDLPAGIDPLKVSILEAGAKATVEATLPAGKTIAAGNYSRAALITIAGGPPVAGGCFLRYASLGDPPLPPSVKTAAGSRPAATGLCQVPVVSAPTSKPFRRGDANGDGKHDVSDPVAIIAYLFLAGPGPCADAMDADDSGVLDVTDPVYDIQFQFLSGPSPPPPGPGTCGVDPTTERDALDCKEYAAPCQ